MAGYRAHIAGVAVALTAGAMVSAPAWAQSTATTAPAAEAKDAPVAIERVVVTARKVSELVGDVPVAISAVKADDMLKENTVGIRDLFSKVPGLSLYQAGQGRNSMAIRGVTTGSNGNSAVAVSIDDAPFGSSKSNMLMPDIDPFDLQRIEVLRGPQGTLYGAASLGGLVKYVMVEPTSDKLSGRVQVDGSSVSHGSTGYGLRAAVNVPVVSDKLAVRVSAFDRHDPGWVDDTLQNQKDVNEVHVRGGRLAAAWTPTEDIKVKGSVMQQKTDADASSTIDVDAAHVPLAGDFTHQRMPGTDGYTRKVDFADLVVEADLKWANLTSVTSNGKLSSTFIQDGTDSFQSIISGALGIPGLGTKIVNPSVTKKFSQEVRLESPVGSSNLEWRVGLFYTDEKTDGAQFMDVRTPATGAVVAGIPILIDVNAKSSFVERAVFGSVTYHFTPDFDVQVGGRYTKNKQTYNDSVSGILNGVGNGGAPVTHAYGSDENASTYVLTPRYKLGKNMMVFGTLSSGYRPGGPNTATATNIPLSYKSDTTRNTELGFKGEFLDGRLAIATSIYHISWTDIQLQQRDATTNFSYTGNSGAARSQGVEFSAELVPVRGLNIKANVTYSDSKLTENAPTPTVAFKGDRVPFVSPWSGGLQVNKNLYLFDSAKTYVGLGATYVGPRYMDFLTTTATPRREVPGYTTLDLYAGLQKDTWTINAFLRNATDRKALTTDVAKNSLNPATGNFSVTYIQPRTAGVSVATTF